MNEKIIQIPVDELLESLREGYTEYKKALGDNADADDLGHIKGFCVTIEQILSAYGGVTSATMMEIKRPIIGEISLRRKKRIKKSTKEIDYEIPTFLRKSEN